MTSDILHNIVNKYKYQYEKYYVNNNIVIPPKIKTKDRRGYIYSLYSLTFEYIDCDICKIGRTNDIKRRISELSTPLICKMVPLHISQLCYDVIKAENILSKKLKRYNINREIYKLNYDDVIKNINHVVNQVNNYVLLPLFYVFISVFIHIFNVSIYSFCNVWYVEHIYDVVKCSPS